MKCFSNCQIQVCGHNEEHTEEPRRSCHEAFRAAREFRCVIFMSSEAHEIDQYRNYSDACSYSTSSSGVLAWHLLHFLKKNENKNKYRYFCSFQSSRDSKFLGNTLQLNTHFMIPENFDFISTPVHWRGACDKNWVIPIVIIFFNIIISKSTLIIMLCKIYYTCFYTSLMPKFAKQKRRRRL